MEITVITIVLSITSAATVTIHYDGLRQSLPIIAPATSYIYRSDNDGPGSLIRLGPQQQYAQPKQFAQPIPITQSLYTHPIAASFAPNAQIVALPAQTITVPENIKDKLEEKAVYEDNSEDYEDEDAPEDENNDNSKLENNDDEYYDDDEYDSDGSYNEEDENDYEEGTEESQAHSDVDHNPRETQAYLAHLKGHGADSFVKEEGNDYNEEKSASHGEKGKESYDSNHAFDKGSSGHHEDENHESYNSDGGEKDNKHYIEKAHKAHHEASEHGDKGAQYGKKKSFNKGEKTTGFHNVYHKDEYKKNKEFFDDSDESGYFKKHKNFDAKHGSSSAGKDLAEKHKSESSHKSYGKKGHTEKGHHDEKESGFDDKHGNEEYNKEHSNHKRKGGRSSGKFYGHEDDK